MVILKFADTHNMVAFLSKPAESDGFEQIVDFLNAHPIKYALTVNPTIYTSCIEQFWSTVVAKTINGEVQLHALVDGKKIIITESTVRRDLQLEDAEGVDCLPNSTIFEQLALMGPKTTAWNEFSSTMASAIICLATNQKFNFSKYIFESMVRNLDNLSGKFLMYPSSQETNSCGGPGCQETMGDTTARTRFESVSKHSNDSLLARGNTLQSDEDRLKLNELMELCTTLQQRVLDLEKTKTTQPRVESSGDEEDLEVVDAAQVSTAATTVTITTEEITLAQALEALKTSKTKDDIQAKIDVDHQLAERLQAQEQEELSNAEKATLFQQLLEKRRKHFAAKRA
ncbi:hypothetical protein Tco_0535766 [Tanacetum coccineum]